MTLADATAGSDVRVESVDLGDEQANGWLSAVGIGAGERLTVLRRAAFGGPLHVATSSGGEFALAVAVARRVTVTPVDARAPSEGGER